MKKSLLLLASAMFGAAAFAQNWTKPTPKAEASFEYSTTTDDGGYTPVYYLYNSEAQAFFTEGNSWGTQASFGPSGLKVAITQYVAEGAEWDGKTVFINDYSLAKKAWKKLFIDSESQSFVDLGKQLNYFWEITETATSGTYNIKGAEVNPVYNNGFLFGIDANTILNEQTTISPYLDPVEDATAMVNWQFISESEYAVYQAKLTLYDALNQAAEEGISYAAAETVYNNASASVEDIKSAASALLNDIKNAEFNKASEDNPANVSNWLVNADFSAGNIDGWECSFVSGTNAKNVGYQSNKDYSNGDVTISKFIEAWTPTAYSSATTTAAIGVGRLCQTIADMPAGKYRLSVDCIAVNQYDAALNPVSGVQLFATGGEIDLYTAIATGNGLPEHFELEFMNSGGEITMGLRTTEACTANWIAADNFQLWYLGKSVEDPYKTALDNLIASSKNDIDPEGLDEVIANAEAKKAYKEAMETAETTEDYKASIDAINSTLSALKASVSAYTKLTGVKEYYDKTLATGIEYDSAEWGEFADYMNGEADDESTFPYIIANGTIADADIPAKVSEVHAMFKNAIVKAVEGYKGGEGMNVTGFITNASFETGDMTGWSRNSSASADTGVKANSNETYTITNADGDYVFNTWHDSAVTFWVEQTLSGIPAGVYEVTALVASDEGNEITISADEQTVKIATANPKETGEDVSLKFIVAKGQESVTIKVTSESWFKADNFRLVFKGLDEESLREILLSDVETVGAYVESVELTTPVQDAVTKAIDKAQDAAGSTEIAASIDELAQVLDDAKANAAALEDFKNATQILANAVDSPANESAIPEAETIMAECESYMDLGTKDLIALTEKVTYIAGKLATVIPDGADWTSLIVNPAFDEGNADGWKCAFTTIKNIGYQANHDYSNTEDGVTISKFVEGWIATGNSIGDGSIEQTIAYLPAGSYTLAVDAVANNQSSTEENWEELTSGVYLFAAQNGEVIAKQEIKSGNGAPRHFDLTFAAKEGSVTIGLMTESATANWIAADNWTLTLADPSAIKSANTTTAAAGIYSVSGARINGMQKGINIVKMADGSVKKVLVK